MDNTEVAPIIHIIIHGQDRAPWNTIMSGVYKIAAYDAVHKNLSSFKSKSAGMKWLLAELVYDEYFVPCGDYRLEQINHLSALDAIEMLVEYAKNHPREKV